MVAPKILDFFDRSLIDSVGGLVMCPDGIAQGRGRGERDTGQFDALEEVLLPSGCAALYRKAMLVWAFLSGRGKGQATSGGAGGAPSRWKGSSSIPRPT